MSYSYTRDLAQGGQCYWFFQSVTMSSSSINIGLGDFPAYQVSYQRDNWGEKYVNERFDVSEREYLSPEIGLIYRMTTRYVNFLDCFTCPIYQGSSHIELVGYYIPQADGTVLKDGYGYNPNNPYGGDLGQLTIWAGVDIGNTEVFWMVSTLERFQTIGLMD